jgi:hypothetical protein
MSKWGFPLIFGVPCSLFDILFFSPGPVKHPQKILIKAVTGGMFQVGPANPENLIQQHLRHRNMLPVTGSNFS